MKVRFLIAIYNLLYLIYRILNIELEKNKTILLVTKPFYYGF